MNASQLLQQRHASRRNAILERWDRAALAGVVGTIANTATQWGVAPMVGFPRMNLAAMWASRFDGNMIFGWLAHGMIGVVLALIYALVATKLPGSPAVRGFLFGLALWLMAMVLMLPIIGMPLFGGDLLVAIGSLAGHAVYGATVGGIYGPPEEWHALALDSGRTSRHGAPTT